MNVSNEDFCTMYENAKIIDWHLSVIECNKGEINEKVLANIEEVANKIAEIIEQRKKKTVKNGEILPEVM